MEPFWAWASLGKSSCYAEVVFFPSQFPLWMSAGGDLGIGLCCRFGVSKEKLLQTPSSFPTSPDPQVPHTLLPAQGDVPLLVPLSPQRDTRTCTPWQGYEIPPRLAHRWEFNLSRAGTL